MRKIYILLSIFLISSNPILAKKSIVINLTNQEIYAYQNGKLVMQGPVSTGKPGYRTPTGTFRILEKDLKHVSSKYPEPNGGARMDYMMRLTHSGIAMHLGYVPNYPASHGCIRLKNGFAQRLYKWARVGTKVVIKGSAPVRVSRRNKKRGKRASRKRNRVRRSNSYDVVEVVQYTNPPVSNHRLREQGVVVLDDFDSGYVDLHRNNRRRVIRRRRSYQPSVRGDREEFIYVEHQGKRYTKKIVHLEDTPAVRYVDDPYIRGVKVLERY